MVLAQGGSRVVDKFRINADVAVDSTASGNVGSIAILEGYVVVVLIIWPGRAAVVAEAVVVVIGKDVVGNDRIVIRASIGVAHYQPARPVIQRRIICDDYRGCRMVKVNTVVPGVNDKIIDDLSVRIRMIQPMNGNVAGALGG